MKRQHLARLAGLHSGPRNPRRLLGILLAGSIAGCSGQFVPSTPTVAMSSSGATTSTAGEAESGSQRTTSTGTGGSKYALPSERNFAWNPGLMSKGGIPSLKSPICNSTPLVPSGSADDSAQINAQIRRCPVGSVVQLDAGTFVMGKGQYIAINKSVVLRGTAAGSTILKNPLNVFATPTFQQAADPTPLVIIGPGRWVNPDGDARCQTPTPYQPAHMQLLSTDALQGAMSITVANGSIYSAGQMVLVDETSGASWQSDVAHLSLYIWASPDYSVVWQLHKPSIPFIDDPLATGLTPSAANNYAGTGSGNDAACWFSRQDRPQNEIKEIANVNGNTITFTSPLTKGYRVSHYAELTTYSASNAPVQNAGIEQMTLVGGGDGALRFESTRYSWARNIEVMEWYGEGVAINNSIRDEIRDSYIHDAAWAEPGGAGYAISLASGSSETLIENNVVVKANKLIVVRSSGAGSVVGYNYMDHGYIATTQAWIEVGLNASHMVGSHMVLFEGNQSFNMDSDTTHGNSTFIVYFRNYSTSVRSIFKSDYTGDSIDDANDIPGPANGPKRAAGAARYSYWMTYVGNVLGQPQLATAARGYLDDQARAPWRPTTWLMGWNDKPPYTVDPGVIVTSVRDGNWETLLGKQTWLNGSAGPLPDSLYLSGKPAFFGSNSWPWLDPTTGATHILPAQARYSAGTPNVVH
jgi:hypothetical protein